MSLPHIFGPIAGGTQIPLSFLDDNFNALGAMTIIPCTASGTNAISLTPLASTTVPAAYANYQMFGFVAANTSSGAVTAAFLALGARNVYLADGVTQAGSGNIVAGVFYIVAFNSALNGGAGGFEILAPAIVTPFPATPVQTFTGDHTVVSADRGNELRMNSASAHVFNLSSGASLGNGFNIDVLNINTGVLSLTANGSDLIRTKNSTFTTILLPSVGDGGHLVCDGGSPAVWSWKGKRSKQIADFASTISTDTAAPHTLGVEPDYYKVQLVCTINNLNYTAGQVVTLGVPQINAGGGFVMLPDATNINFKTANVGIGIPNATTFVVTAITTADWNFRVTATVID